MPVVRLKLSSGVWIRAIVDTGSESTVIDYRFVQEHFDLFETKQSSRKIDVVTATGIEKRPLIIATCKSSLKRKIPISCSVQDLSRIITYCNDEFKQDIKMILGSDILKQYNAIIDYESKELRFDKI